MAAHVIRKTESLCARLASEPNSSIDLYTTMQTFSLEIAATWMFSVEASGFRNQLQSMVSEYITTVGKPRTQDFLLPDWTPTPLKLRRQMFRRRWRHLISTVVEHRRAMPKAENPRDLLDLLVRAHADENAELLLDEVSTMIVVGYETTALALFWTLYLVARVPSWQSAMRDEARAVDLSAASAVEALTKLPRTRAIINETLRLYTPAFMIGRLAVTETTIAGQHVPSGSIVLAPLWILHRRPDAWQEPGVFDPTRFLEGPEPDRYRFLPFGIGPHVCIGAQLAMTELIIVLTRLISEFEVSLVDAERPVQPVAILTTRPDHAPAFRLRPMR